MTFTLCAAKWSFKTDLCLLLKNYENHHDSFRAVLYMESQSTVQCVRLCGACKRKPFLLRYRWQS